MHLSKALALPAAQSIVLKAASIDKAAKKIRKNLDAEVDVKALMKAFPELEFAEVMEIAKLYTARQSGAVEASNKLVSAVLRVQNKVAPSNTLNVQFKTGDVSMGGPSGPADGCKTVLTISGNASQGQLLQSPEPKTPTSDHSSDSPE